MDGREDGGCECGVRGREREWGCVAVAWVVASASAMSLRIEPTASWRGCNAGGGCRGQVDGLWGRGWCRVRCGDMLITVIR